MASHHRRPRHNPGLNQHRILLYPKVNGVVYIPGLEVNFPNQ